MLPLHIKRKLLNKAKRNAPIDSGNLRFNAIRGGLWTNKNKFRITYDTSVAHYVEYLEENAYAGGSTTKLNKNRKFIEKTVIELKNDLVSYYNKGKEPFRKRSYSENKDNAELRDINRRIQLSERSYKINELRREANKE